MTESITIYELKSKLSYDPNTGVFCRLKTGVVVGTDNGFGYLRVKINGRAHMLHRLAWLYVYQEWPKDEIDHIDRNKKNNSINNLRLATRSQNQLNKPATKNNRSGFKGIHWCKRDQRWIARVQVGGSRKIVAYCRTPEEAYTKREVFARQIYGEFFCE